MYSNQAYEFIEKMLEEEGESPHYYLPPDTPLTNIPCDWQLIYVNYGQIRIRIDIKEDGQLRSTWVEHVNEYSNWVDMNFSQEIWIKIHRFLENIWEECPNKKIALSEGGSC